MGTKGKIALLVLMVGLVVAIVIWDKVAPAPGGTTSPPSSSPDSTGQDIILSAPPPPAVDAASAPGSPAPSGAPASNPLAALPPAAAQAGPAGSPPPAAGPAPAPLSPSPAPGSPPPAGSPFGPPAAGQPPAAGPGARGATGPGAGSRPPTAGPAVPGARPGGSAGSPFEPTPAPGFGEPSPLEHGATAGGKTHKVQQGDSLWSIAVKYYKDGTKMDVIRDANKDKIGHDDMLKVGTVLTIPEVETAAGRHGTDHGIEPAAGPGEYKVKSGDTLSSIAKDQLGKEYLWEEIAKANEEKLHGDPHRLKVGMILKIPAAGDIRHGAGTDRPLREAEIPPELAGKRTYRIKSGDNLSKIAKEQLGSATKWEKIYELNRDRIDPEHLKVGQVIVLPEDGGGPGRSREHEGTFGEPPILPPAVDPLSRPRTTPAPGPGSTTPPGGLSPAPAPGGTTPPPSTTSPR